MPARKSQSLMSLIMFAVLFSLTLNQVVIDSLPFSKSGYDYNNFSNWGFDANNCDALYSPINIPTCTSKACGQYFKFSLKNKFNALVSEDMSVNLAGNFGILKVLSPKNKVLALVADKIEFRAPAGHQLNSTSYDGEIQFYFKANKKAATNYVVSVFLSAQKCALDSKDIFQKTFNSARVSNEAIIYQRAHNAKNVVVPSALRRYFKLGKTFFRYIGSLASPVIGKGVTWFVFEEPITVSRDDYEFLLNKYSGSRFNKGNNAAIQPLNNRTITYAKISNVLPKVKKAKRHFKISSANNSHNNKLNYANSNSTVNATAATNSTKKASKHYRKHY